LQFSIGDIVRVYEYGNRFACQRKVFDGTKFTITSKDFNHPNKISETPYMKCNEIYAAHEWKIIDVGIFDSTCKLVLRLKDREFCEMLFTYDTFEKYHGFYTIRRAKNQVYSINFS
jgi:hypothetical protein